MPRLAPSLFRRAGRISPHLATLLPVCRTVASARAELRWICEHVRGKTSPAPASPFNQRAPPPLGNRARARRAGIARLDACRSATQTDLRRSGSRATEYRIARLVARRGAGEPLQYVLGTQPFGDLEILCEKGVLIPRPETEAWAAMLADLALSSRGRAQGQAREGKDLRILDLCSGTGCIGLSLYARGTAPSRRRGATKGQEGGERGTRAQGPVWRVFGFDVEPRAVRLARKNLRHNFRGPPRRSHGSVVVEKEDDDVDARVTFEQADVFTDTWMTSLDDDDDDNPSQYTSSDEERRPSRRRIDILVSNPPYISQRGFETDTARSVRHHEPKRALVPSRPPSPVSCAPEDVFYARLLEIADTLRPRIAAFEVGDMAQAMRVVEMAITRCRRPEEDGRGDRDGLVSARWDVLEIWRDWPDCLPSEAEEDVVVICGRRVPVRGNGHGRVVFLSEGPIPRNRSTNRGFRRIFYAE
ncbi:S-adenosyl-L-methionine-dependent methyltransferase [Xylaria scruposa]|nr:S-adenosyl-L-methionine-dependent methyltransferase [Xylaria scruposa]